MKSIDNSDLSDQDAKDLLADENFLALFGIGERPVSNGVAELSRVWVQRNDLRDKVAKWRDMPDDEMRLRAGEMTAQEIRTVRAVLSAILPP